MMREKWERVCVLALRWSPVKGEKDDGGSWSKRNRSIYQNIFIKNYLPHREWMASADFGFRFTIFGREREASHFKFNPFRCLWNSNSINPVWSDTDSDQIWIHRKSKSKLKLWWLTYRVRNLMADLKFSFTHLWNIINQILNENMPKSASYSSHKKKMFYSIGKKSKH